MAVFQQVVVTTGYPLPHKRVCISYVISNLIPLLENCTNFKIIFFSKKHLKIHEFEKNIPQPLYKKRNRVFLFDFVSFLKTNIIFYLFYRFFIMIFFNVYNIENNSSLNKHSFFH